MRIQLDLSPERTKLYKEALGRLHHVEITGGSAADAVIAGDATRAGNSKVPCLVDRPETFGVDELAAMAESDGGIMPAHEWRFLPNSLTVSRSAHNGELGVPGLLRIHHWISESSAMQEIALPQIDLAQWLFGAKAEITHALQRPDYLQMHFGFPDNGMAMIDLATGRPGSLSYYSLHLIGSDGAAYADDHHNAQLLFSGEGACVILHPHNQLLARQKMLDEFISGIMKNRDWSVDLKDTLEALNTLKKGELA